MLNDILLALVNSGSYRRIWSVIGNYNTLEENVNKPQ